MPSRRASTVEDPLVNGKGQNPCENVGDLCPLFLAGALSSLPSR